MAVDQGSTSTDPLRAVATQVQLAREYVRLSNPKAAFDAINQAIKINNQYPEAYMVKGMILADLKQNQEAEENFQRALRYGANHAEVNHRYGLFLCMNRAEPAKSFAFFDRSLMDPLYANRFDVMVDMARCQMQAEDWINANKTLLSLLSVKESVPLLLMMTEVQLKLQQLKLAQYYVDRLKMYTVSPSPSYFATRIRLARALGYFDEEHYYIRELKQQFPHAYETQQLILEE